MGAVVGRELNPLDRPTLPVRQVFFLQPGKERQDLRKALLVIDVFDPGAKSRRVRGDVILKRHGNIDQATDHCLLLLIWSRSRMRSGAA
jgi:hypothetical protein